MNGCYHDAVQIYVASTVSLCIDLSLSLSLSLSFSLSLSLLSRPLLVCVLLRCEDVYSY